MFPVLHGQLWPVAAIWDDTDTVCLRPRAHAPLPLSPECAQVSALLWVHTGASSPPFHRGRPGSLPNPHLGRPHQQGAWQAHPPQADQSLPPTVACHFLSQCGPLSPHGKLAAELGPRVPSLFPDLIPHTMSPATSWRWVRGGGLVQP